MAVIEARDVVKRFGSEEVLKGVDLVVEKGEIFGLIGPSGSGKSTLLRTMTGYLAPSGGKVEVLGRPPVAFGPGERRRVGFMPQGFVLYGDLSVRQNLNFVAGLYGLRLGERRRRVRETLEFVELWDDRRKAARDISGGMQRRLQLAAAVVHEPELLFVDEPTANLDPVLRRRFWKEFRTLSEGGRTLFVTTQYVGEAELCDRVGLLADGKLVAVGTPEQLRREAFGGETVELTLGGEPSRLAAILGPLEELGRGIEVRQEDGNDGAVSVVRLLVDDADSKLPEVLKALDGVDVRSAHIPRASFDEVFFRLMKDQEQAPDAR